MPNRTVITGSPGSGKTTYMHANAKPGDLLWDFDDFAASLGFGRYPRPADITRLIMRFRKSLLMSAAFQHRNSWLIITDSAMAAQLAGKIGAKLVNMDEQDG